MRDDPRFYEKSVLQTIAQNMNPDEHTALKSRLEKAEFNLEAEKEERDRITAERDHFRKDKKRLDWLEKQCARVKYETEDEASLPRAHVYIPNDLDASGWQSVGAGHNYREAIDDAMGQIARSTNVRKFKAGDVVFHRPTGETWTLAKDEQDGWVYPGGWPQSQGRTEDCKLVEPNEPTSAERLAVHDSMQSRSMRSPVNDEPQRPPNACW